MSRIEVFYKYHAIKPIAWLEKLTKKEDVLVILADKSGGMHAIYEDHNDVEPGKYDVYIYQPFLKEGEKLKRIGLAGYDQIEVKPEVETDHIVIDYWFSVSSYYYDKQAIGLSPEEWITYAKRYVDRFGIPTGWSKDFAYMCIDRLNKE